ncbi:MAG TPA: hypothetical protein VGS41_07715 [Chthonomonadales bacterium]|nr:hypothetical protein [Chthonomonadales bacterium]
MDRLLGSGASLPPCVSVSGKVLGTLDLAAVLILLRTIVLGKRVEFTIALSMFVINAIVSFSQERRSAGVAESLKQRLQVSVWVLRDSSLDRDCCAAACDGQCGRAANVRYRPHRCAVGRRDGIGRPLWAHRGVA